MKKITGNLLFTALWKGVLAVFVLAVICVLLKCIKDCKKEECNPSECYHAESLGPNIYYHDTDDGRSFVYNNLTGEKTLDNIKWIAMPQGADSLVCFSNGKKRGYFSKYSGRVVIEPIYNHAWIFSNGLACVEEGGYIKFIDGTGKTVIDRKIAYNPNMSDCVFHEGYCIVYTDDGQKCGLMDVTGRITLPMEYNYIYPTNDFKFWRIQKGEEYGVLNNELKPIVPLMECSSMDICDGTIIVTMLDYSIRHYDMQGTLINDFYISSFRMLEYEKEEIVYRKNTVNEVGEDNVEASDVSYHPKATARLRAYVAGNGYEGLMTADGHKVTMPLYWEIVALDHDLYLCSAKNGDKVIVNGKGEIVK